MARVATKLTPRKSGGWIARKRIAADVQGAYATLYGVRWEERLNLEAMPIDRARLNTANGKTKSTRASSTFVRSARVTDRR